jgi:hypothetical protein
MAEADNREQELEALQRSYRMMETDRQKYSEESQVCTFCRFPTPPTHSAGTGAVCCVLSLALPVETAAHL